MSFSFTKSWRSSSTPTDATAVFRCGVVDALGASYQCLYVFRIKNQKVVEH
jgi:hypothetical protein